MCEVVCRPDLKKGTCLRQNTHFEPSTMKIGLFVRAVREPEKVNKKKPKKRTRTLYFTYAWGRNP
jgi:hypothetical protein